ncbi:MAG: hypothetical protein HGA45_21670, partial [Chloroflexales bacterium]|nr:hypothetical protein [Chloroflexales bacterium]
MSPTQADEPASLELMLVQHQAGVDLSLRCIVPSESVDRYEGPFPITLDPEQLRATPDPDSYGAALSRMLFAAQRATTTFALARAAAQLSGHTLRVRLHIAAGPQLHQLRWETLRDPEVGRRLALDPQTQFSRYLGAEDWSPVALRPRGELRALAVVAAPADLATYQLAPLDAATEL